MYDLKIHGEHFKDKRAAIFFLKNVEPSQKNKYYK